MVKFAGVFGYGGSNDVTTDIFVTWPKVTTPPIRRRTARWSRVIRVAYKLKQSTMSYNMFWHHLHWLCSV